MSTHPIALVVREQVRRPLHSPEESACGRLVFGVCRGVQYRVSSSSRRLSPYHVDATVLATQTTGSFSIIV